MSSHKSYQIELHFYTFVGDDVIEYIATEWEKRFAKIDEIGSCRLELSTYTMPTVSKDVFEHDMAVVKVTAYGQKAREAIVKLFEDAHTEHIDEMGASDIRVFEYE